VYYAHLASNRARAHENRPASEGAAGGQKFEEFRQDTRGRVPLGGASTTGSGSQQMPEPLPLLPLGNLNDPELTPLIRPLRTGMCTYAPWIFKDVLLTAIGYI
jgi:eukaryotic translation initiation factor 2C